MLNGDCFGFVLELFETGDSLDEVGPVEAMAVLCVARPTDGRPLIELPAVLDVLLDTAVDAVAGKLSTFSTPLLIGDESTLVVSFVCKKFRQKIRVSKLPRFKASVDN